MALRSAGWQLVASCFLVVAVGGGGCNSGGSGGPATPIEGTVTLDGKPLEMGMVSFEAADGKGGFYQGPIQGGQYMVIVPANAIKGEMIVRVQGTIRTGRRVPIGAGGAMVEEIITLPPKYNTKSELRFKPKPAEPNTHKIELTLR
jgi:hypothetical protein